MNLNLKLIGEMSIQRFKKVSRRDLNLRSLALITLILLCPGPFLQPGARLSSAFAADGGTDTANNAAVSTATHTLFLEEEEVWINIYSGSQAGFTFVNLHDNENTSAEAARTYIDRYGGQLVELVHGRGRNVAIRRQGVLNSFDPNRMFSENDLRRSLDYYGTLNEENYAVAADFAARVVEFVGIEEGKVIIDVHNNTDDNFSINGYGRRRRSGQEGGNVFINPEEDPDDFFMTNSPTLFQGLQSMGYNISLMRSNRSDRGTLGALASRMGGIYILVEAEHGHLTKQIQMLEDLGRLLGSEP